MGLAVTYGAAGTEDAVASGTAPRGFGCTCGQVLRLAVGGFPMFYYKESAFGFGRLYWFSPMWNTTSYV